MAPIAKNSTVAVTGAAGFIGSVLAVRLLEADYRQLVLVDDFSVEAKQPNHTHLPVTAKVDRVDFPQWLEDNDSCVYAGGLSFSCNDSPETNVQTCR